MLYDLSTEKAALRAVLNTCTRQGMSAEETIKALEVQFAASCLACDIAHVGQCPCDAGKKCFIEEALNACIEKVVNK